ncbi:MAG: hypothetical protein AUG91_02575 [Actinobacteria bacterium 13_1_20CM_4_69_9]|nr:MAG: hypothetical protein AUG91_02575 [Actinobacteria bacterium 13_1_20CM_4_69_9]
MVSSRADRRLAGVVLVLAATTLALAGSARTGLSGGRVIKGTNGGDLLRGGPRADIVEGLDGNDRLYGRGGDDRLYGGGGDDRLFGGRGDDKLAGGPGVDRFSCGRGRDIVYTSASGQVSRDCEIVHRSAAPTAGLATGPYRGDAVSFVLAGDARSLSSLKIDFKGNCPAGTAARIQFAQSGPFAVQAQGTFAVDDQESNGDSVKVSGTIRSGGVANGTFALHTADCDTGNVSWTARHG